MIKKVSKSLTVSHQLNPVSQGLQVVQNLVLILPFALVILMQAAHIGLATNIGSDIQTSDSAGWVSCQSAFAQFHLESQANWCSRRPLAFMLPIPVYWLSPFSLAGVVLIQVALLSIASWALFHRLLSSFGPPLIAALLSAATMIWLIIQYGTSAGPEALALLLSLSATSSYIRFLGSGSIIWATVSTALTAGAFLTRPGNPVLLVAICALAVLLVRRRTADWRRAVIPLIPVVLLVGLLNRVIRSLGLTEAGHGSNFWATVHSAADPEIDGWPEVYEKYSDVVSAIGTENRAFASFLRDETISLLVNDPLPFAFQFLQNIVYFLLRGFINLFSGFPLGRRSQLSSIEDVVRGDISVFQWSVLWLGCLVLLALSLTFLSAWMLYRLGLELVRSLGSPPDESSRTRGLRQILINQDLRVQGVLVGACSVFGSLIFFGVVGHDEISRHLVMSVPWALYGILAIYSGQPSGYLRENSPNSRNSVRTLACFLLVAAAVLGFADARRGTAIIALSPRCAGPVAAVENWRIVASAPMGSSTKLDIGSDWRRLSTSTTRHFDTPLFMADGILAISGGHLVSLKSLENGEIRTIFLPETQIPSVRSASPMFEIVDDNGLASLRSCG